MKKGRVLGLVLGGFLVIGSLVGCSSTNVGDNDSVKIPIVQEKKSAIDLSEAATMIENLAKDSFEYSKVEYDNDKRSLILNVTTTGISNDYLLADRELIKVFEGMMVDTSISMKSSLSTIVGTSDFTFSFRVLNDQDLNKILLAIDNGTIIYSASNN